MIDKRAFLTNAANGRFWLKSDKKQNNAQNNKRQTVGKREENTKSLIVTSAHGNTTKWSKQTERRLHWEAGRSSTLPCHEVGGIATLLKNSKEVEARPPRDHHINN